MQDSIKTIKKFLYSMVAVGLGILMVVAFTLPGSVMGNRAHVIGTVNGKAIEAGRGSLFMDSYYRLVEHYKSQGVTPSGEAEQAIRQQAFQETVSSELTIEAAKKYGMHVSDVEILNAIKSRYFVKDGIFDSRSYEGFKHAGDPIAKAFLERNTRYLLYRGYVDYTLFHYIPLSEVQKQKQIKDYSLERTILLSVKNFNSKKALESFISSEDLNSFYTQHQDTLYKDKTYQEAENDVRKDYLTTNLERVFLVAKEAFLQEGMLRLQAAKTPEVFRATCQQLQIECFSPEPFNIYTETFYDSEGNPINFMFEPRLIEIIYLTPINSVSEAYHTDTMTVIVYVIKQEMNSKIAETFRKDEVILEYQNKLREDVSRSYRAYLEKKAEIISYAGNAKP